MASELMNYLKIFADMDGIQGGMFFKHRYENAKGIKVSKLEEVFTPSEIKRIKALRPEKKMCYKNAYMLAELFPDRVEYVEGMMLCVIGIDHAFNKVGDKYVDITSELVLKQDPSETEYVEFKTWGLDEVRMKLLEYKVWGDFYRKEWFEAFMKR